MDKVVFWGFENKKLKKEEKGKDNVKLVPKATLKTASAC